MKTGNFPRYNISSNQLPFAVGAGDWLISVTDYGGTDLTTQLEFERSLFVKFNDIDTKNGTEISPVTAERIARFIVEAREEQVNVWVNCHAGVCRSGAIVALLIDLGWEDAKSPASPGRIPNHLVYNMVRQHFPEVRQSWDPEPLTGLTEIWVPFSEKEA